MPHIPTQPTSSLKILPFAEALAVRTEPCPYDRSRWLYVPDSYSEYRYVLGTCGERPLLCLGINPSTAAPDHLDNTLKSVERIALANRYDSFWMMNIYAQRATDPDHMEKECNQYLHCQNLEAFRYLLSRITGEPPSVWAAWGAIITKRTYLLSCTADFVRAAKDFGTRWFTAGARSVHGGHPHHPLYLKKDSRLETFDPCAYLQALGQE